MLLSYLYFSLFSCLSTSALNLLILPFKYILWITRNLWDIQYVYYLVEVIYDPFWTLEYLEKYLWIYLDSTFKLKEQLHKANQNFSKIR